MFRGKTKARLKFNVNSKWKIIARSNSKVLNLFKIRRQTKNEPSAT